MKPIRVPDLAPRSTCTIGRTVPLHPQHQAQDSRRRAATDRGADRRDRPRQRGDGAPLAQALPPRGSPGPERRAASFAGRRPAQGEGGVPRGSDLHAVRRRPRSSLGLAVLAMDARTVGRLHGAERTAIRVHYETVRVHLKAAGIVLSRPQHTITSPDPEYALKKRRSKRPARALSPEITSTTPRSST